jgi:hypothetical protein
MASDDNKPTQEREPFLIPMPVIVILAPPFFLVVHFVILWFMKYDYLSSLWKTVLGVRWLVISSVLFLIGEALWTSLTLVAHYRRPRSGWWILVYTGFVLIPIVFFAPAVLVLVLGPAAIQIVEGFG